MTKKKYIQPASDILPFGTMVALCASGEIPQGLGGGESGGNSYTDGRAPHRTPAF